MSKEHLLLPGIQMEGLRASFISDCDAHISERQTGPTHRAVFMDVLVPVLRRLVAIGKRYAYDTAAYCTHSFARPVDTLGHTSRRTSERSYQRTSLFCALNVGLKDFGMASLRDA